MGKKQRRLEAEQDHAQLLRRELAWLDTVSGFSTEIIFGAPMRCPGYECGDFGLVESVTEGRQHNRCWSCGTTWSMSRRAMAMFAQARKAPEPQAVVGAGTLVADLDPAAAAKTTRERLAEALLREPPPMPYLPNA